MLHSKARWEIVEPIQEQIVHQLIHDCDIDPLLAKLLVVRGYTDAQQVKAFLYGRGELFYDPFMLDHMKEAVERIKLAIEQAEKIRIYGDYDADGVSSTSLMVLLFRQLGANFDYYIPHRVQEGYGLNKSAIDTAKDQHISLLVTVDNGISAREEVAYAQSLGIDVIITDHHEPPDVLPEALAIINPKKPGCGYPFKQLAGVGVAFKLAHAILNEIPAWLLDIAAIGTVADLMPLVDENRLIVKLGIERLRTTTHIGLKSLLQVADVNQEEASAGHIGFALAPRINAAGRLDSADKAVNLLVTSNEQEAHLLAKELDQLNKERQNIVEQTAEEAIEQIRLNPHLENNKVIILAKEDWNVGVIGIVASKILERYYRPTIILSIDKKTGIAKGSARSIAGFDIYQALCQCSDLFTHFGGHQAAAGMSLAKENLTTLDKRLNKIALDGMKERDLIPVKQVDIECSLSDVSLETIQQIERLAPFGMGNPSPKFVLRGLQLQEMRRLGKEQQHLKLTLTESSSRSIEAIGFHQGSLEEHISPRAEVDVLGELSINEWNGHRKPQVIMQDISIPHVQLFDWRGVKDPVSKLDSWFEKQECKNHGSTGLLLTTEKEWEKIEVKLQQFSCSIWLIDSAGTIIAMNAVAKEASLSSLRTLILFSLPYQLHDLRNILQKCIGLENVVAIFDTSYGGDDPTLPSRDMFKHVYASLQQMQQWEWNTAFLAALRKRSGLSTPFIQFILDVFEELEFFQKEGTSCRIVSTPTKKPLSTSVNYQRRKNRMEAEQVLIYSTTQQLQAWMKDEQKSHR